MKNAERPGHLDPAARRPGAHIVRFGPARAAREAARHGRPHGPERCGKCASTYIVREPAFVHCRYCGAMSRIHDGSLPAQEEFELRSGLRLAC